MWQMKRLGRKTVEYVERGVLDADSSEEVYGVLLSERLAKDGKSK